MGDKTSFSSLLWHHALILWSINWHGDYTRAAIQDDWIHENILIWLFTCNYWKMLILLYGEVIDENVHAIYNSFLRFLSTYNY